MLLPIQTLGKHRFYDFAKDLKVFHLKDFRIVFSHNHGKFVVWIFFFKMNLGVWYNLVAII
jgi:hypothetical protein